MVAYVKLVGGPNDGGFIGLQDVSKEEITPETIVHMPLTHHIAGPPTFAVYQGTGISEKRAHIFLFKGLDESKKEGSAL